jgi:hypothetical protein
MAPKKPPLTLVRSTATVSPPPRKLGKTGRVLWDTVMTEYQIHDIGGVELLMQACLAADRADALAEIINRDGETIHTKSGLRAHPCHCIRRRWRAVKGGARRAWLGTALLRCARRCWPR